MSNNPERPDTRRSILDGDTPLDLLTNHQVWFQDSQLIAHPHNHVSVGLTAGYLSRDIDVGADLDVYHHRAVWRELQPGKRSLLSHCVILIQGDRLSGRLLFCMRTYRQCDYTLLSKQS